ncbi:MAG: hypothetical protein AABY22_16815 [Nanoarchaeota archaeon]
MNKKQKKNRNILVGILIIVGAIILINLGGDGKFFAVTDGTPVGCKSSVLSIGDVQVSRTGTDLGESVFQVTLSGREGGQCISGYLDSNELEQKIESKLTGKDIEIKYSNPFKITLNRVESAMYYDIDFADPITHKYYKYTPSTSPITTYGLSGINSLSLCGTGTPKQKSCKNQAQGKGYSNSQCALNSDSKASCYGWNFEDYAKTYRLSNDRIREKIEVKIITGDGDVKSAILDTDANQDEVNREGVDSYMTFEGFLLGIDPPQVPEKVASIQGENKIVTTDAGTKAPTSDVCKKKFLGKWSVQESCMAEQNSLAKQGFSTPPKYVNAEIIGQEVKLPLSKDALYPVIKIQVKAKWLGIYEPVAEPELSNCQGVNLEYRNKREALATYDLKIKEGTGEQGSFNIYSSCQDGFQVNPSENTKTITGTESVSGQIKVNQFGNEDASSTCEIKASIKRLGFTAEDSCTFTAIGTKSCATTTEACSTNTDCCEGLSCNSGVCQKTPNVEICYNQEDDDNDKLVDCFDKDCKDSNYCGDGNGGGQNATCVQEGQKISKDQTCCAGLDKKGGFLFFKKPTCVKTLPKCADCDAFAQNKILGGIFEKKQCERTLLPPQTLLTCPFAFIKLFLVPIVFLFELLFTPAMIGRYFRRYKGFAWLIGLILAGIVAYVFYTSLVMGLILAGILLFFQITAGVISLFKKRR